MNGNATTVLPLDAGISAPGCLSSPPSDREGKEMCVDIGPLDDIPLSQGRTYVIGGRAVAVFRERDGRLFAIDNHCPHRGGPLADGVVGDGTVICPLHGWKIELATGRCIGESHAVHAYDVRLVDGHVWLSLECATRGGVKA
jgi:nitrite reductase (NADH) small subunit